MRLQKSVLWIGIALFAILAGKTSADAAPSATPQSVVTAFNTTKAITLTGTDPGNLPLTFSIVTAPTHGTLTGTAPNVTYIPTAGFAGADSFTFRVNNGSQNSPAAAVSITVNPPGPPSATPQSVATAFNTAKAITLAGTDPNGLPLTFNIVTGPTQGTLSGTAPNVTYTPAAGFTGADSFTFRVNNGFQNSSPATVSITVNLPGAPAATAQSVSTAFNTAKAIALTGSDPNGLPLTFSIVTGPTQGVLSGTAPNVTYTPAAGFTGADSFTFRVNNGFLNSTSATVSITVNPPGAPSAAAQSVSTAFNTAKAITLTATDPSSLPLTFTIVTGPTQGTLSGTAPNLTYTPATGFTGADSFTFRVNNGFQNSNAATVSITVNSPPAPSAAPQSVATAFNTAKAITLTGTDPSSLPLTFSIVTGPTQGTLSGTAPNVTYTPATGFTGADSLTFRVNNGFQNSGSATVLITVNSPGAPVANPQSASTAFNTVKAITLTGTDPNNLPLTFSIVTGPAHGTLTGTAPNVAYIPAAGFTGADSFTFRVNNGFQNSSVATVSLTVDLPAAPSATPQSVATAFNTAKAIALTGTDPNNLPLTFSIVTGPAQGTLTGTAPNVTYTPNAGFTGSDSLTFRVNNGFQNSNPTAVAIAVNLPGAPVANPQSVATAFNTAKAITLTGSDPNSLPLTFSIVTGPTHGTLSGTAPNVTYSPTTGYAGPDSFIFRVNNGPLNSNNAAVSITVQSATISFLPPPVINIPGPLTLSDSITLTPEPGSLAASYSWSFIPLTTPTNTGSTAGVISRTQASPQLNLANLGLHVGTYQVRVHGVSGQVTSADAVATLTIVSNSNPGVRVFPNPWRSDRDSDVLITFDQLTPGTTIKIFDMAAHWVRTLSAPSGSVPWDRRNDSGDLVASGMYLYLATDNQGGQTRGKLTVIK